MNYIKLHNTIIDRAKSRQYDSKIHQLHHVIPRCENINSTEVVPLTVKEHYIVHFLRYKMGFDIGNLKTYKDGSTKLFTYDIE